MGKKKGGFLDLDELPEDDAAAAAGAPADMDRQQSGGGAAGPAKQAGGKKGKKGKDKKGKKDAGFDSDEDEVTTLVVPQEDEDLPPQPSKPAAKAKAKKGGKAGKAASGFAALGDEEDEGLQPAGDDDEQEALMPAPKPKAKGKAPGTKKAASLFAALGDDEEEESAAGEEEADAAEEPPLGRLTIVEVTSVAPHPKAADKLRVVEVSTGARSYQVVTNALNVKRGMKVVYAPVGVTTASNIRIEPRTLKGVDSLGMLCSAADIGWTTKADGQLVVLPDDAVVGDPAPSKRPRGEDEEEEEEEAPPAAEEEEEGVTKAAGSKKKKKGKAKDAASLFAALEAGDDEVAEPAEPSMEEEEEAAPAPSPDKKKKKKGTANAASLFAALEAGEEEAQPAAADEEVQESPAADKKKTKKKAADVASLFAALEAGEDAAAEDAEAGEDAEAAAAKKDKKKKKGSKDVDGLFAALAEDAPADGAAEDAEAAPAKKDKKKKKGGKDVDSLFAALAEGAEPPAAAAEEKPQAPAPPSPEPAAGPASKKGKAAAKGADPELDALLAELDAPKQPAAAAAAGGKKKKKGKGGKDGGKDEEDIDALLAAIDGPRTATPEPAAPAAAAPAEAPAEAKEAAKPADEDEEGEGGEDLEALAASGKELTAAQKKKLKKKQKEKEKKAAAAKADVDGGEEAAPAATKGGKPVKESAMARKIREELERRQKAEEAARAAEEAQRAAEEAELRRLEEEEARKAEERRLKKEREKAKREQLKKEGKLLTGKAKAEAERLAAMRAQLLKQAEEKGIVLDTPSTSAASAAESAAAAEAAAAAAEAEKKPKKVVYQTKKQVQKKKEEEAAKAKEEEEARQRAEEEARKAAEEAAAAAAAQAAAQADDEDDWEAAADDWEKVDVDAAKPPAAAAEPPAAAAAKAAAPAAAAGQKAAAPARGKAEIKAADKAAQPAEDEEEEEESGSPEPESEEGSGSEDEEESGSEEGESDDEDSDSEGSESEESDSEDEDSDSDSEEESDDSDDYSMDSEERREMRIEAAREKRLKRAAVARQNAIKEELRSPICCILGHVDVGKTKILDNIRRTNVQEGEAGGITQQIGATFVPSTAIEKRTESLRAGRQFDMKLPGLLVIDTPGHESFTNLRARGSGLCDIAVLIVDLMHGLEQQTIESINLLKMRKTPFIIALNKIDRLYGWKSAPDCPVRDAFKRQKDFVMTEFEQRSSQVFLQLNEQGLNVSLYWKNPDPRKYVNIVPTSAVTGEGIPDLLQLMVKLTQSMMQDRLMYVDSTECTVLEVKTMEGLGTTVDCVLVNGKLREGDRIVVCGLGGPIVTRVKALKTPQVLREMRVKGALMDHKEIRAAMGVKIVAPGLEAAVAGTSLYVIGPEDDEEELKDAVMEDMADIFSKVDKGGEGVCVQASTLGSLEALLTFLNSPEVNIPVSGINIGPVHKKDVLRANVMNEKGAKKYAVILAFDVNVAKEARELAEEFGVKIFTADIIYHLFDQFTAYVKEFKQQEQEAARYVAVFPCVLKIIPTCIFNKKDPIVLGVEVAEGIAKVGTQLCVPSQDGIDLGRIASMELNHKAVDVARAGQSVAMKIEAGNPTEQSRLYGRHFDHNDQLVSRISRESIDALKQHFQDEMTKDDWRLVIRLKKVFQIT